MRRVRCTTFGRRRRPVQSARRCVTSGRRPCQRGTCLSRAGTDTALSPWLVWLPTLLVVCPLPAADCRACWGSVSLEACMALHHCQCERVCRPGQMTANVQHQKISQSVLHYAQALCSRSMPPQCGQCPGPRICAPPGLRQAGNPSLHLDRT